MEIDSVILKNKDEFKKFYTLLSSKININNMKLLYRAGKDGLGLKSFKKKINNNSNLILLFLTGNTRIFGSYFEEKINVIHNKNIKDNNTFSFSVNNNRLYKIFIPEYTI